MRIFDKFPETQVCPICKTNKQAQAFLAAKVDTGEGYNYEACVLHVSCVDLWYDKKLSMLYQKIGCEKDASAGSGMHAKERSTRSHPSQEPKQESILAEAVRVYEQAIVTEANTVKNIPSVSNYDFVCPCGTIKQFFLTNKESRNKDLIIKCYCGRTKTIEKLKLMGRKVK